MMCVLQTTLVLLQLPESDGKPCSAAKTEHWTVTKLRTFPFTDFW